MHEIDLKPRTARATGIVQAVRSITPHMRRITVGGDEIAQFLQVEGIDEPAAWVKVFLPSGEGRVYTIQSINFKAGTLDLDFVLHGTGPNSGPASAWASQASIGEHMGIAGPRNGGFLLPGNAQWVMLAGDATALPGIQSIANRLPAGINAKVYAEVPSPEDLQPIDSPANLRVQWIMAQPEPGLNLCQSLLHRPLPIGPGYIWIAGESAAIRRLKHHYSQERELPRHAVSAKGYWKSGAADHREA